MRDSSISALFGALSNEIRVAGIANNLANVNTTAYKKDSMAFHDVFTRFSHDYVVDTKSYVRGKNMFPDPKIIAKPRLSDQNVNFEQGSLHKTGNQLDFALSGEGLFKVQAGGETLYTRAGNFLVDSTGTLVNQSGLPVQVDGGALTVPPGAKITVNDGGGISINGEAAGTFDLVTFEKIGELERTGSNMYRAPDGLAEQAPEDLTVSQGFLEKSNVNVVTEMVQMLESQRAFEMYGKVLQTADRQDKDMIMKMSRIVG